MNITHMDSEVFKGIDNDIWKGIKGFPDYQISNFGRVKSFKSGRERILKPGVDKDGYLHVSLFNEGKVHLKYIHKLVLEAFLENPENKPECNHKNGNKADNHLQNLEWVSRSENMRHAFKTGLNTHKGENNPCSKLTAKDVLEIVEALKAGITQREIAEKYDVSNAIISYIKSGKYWSHLTGITYNKPYSKISVTFLPISVKADKQFSPEAV